MEPKKIRILRFWELVEGRLYKEKGCVDEYTLKNKVLFNVTMNRYSILRMNDVIEIDFVEVVKKVETKEALLHMDSGGIAECVWNGIKYHINNNTLINMENSKYEFFDLQILNSKWILL